MSSMAPNSATASAERLQERIRLHKEEMARLRAQVVDPQDALFRFIEERFDIQALVQDERPRQSMGETLWEDDDDLNAW